MCGPVAIGQSHNAVFASTTRVLFGANQRILTIDAGLVSTLQGDIGDFVWDDLNENGLHDPNEPGVNGVTVELYSSTGTLIKQTTTANDTAGNPGYYLFTGLAAGSYQVKFIAPTGYMLTKQVTTEANGSKPNPATGFESTIALGANQKIMSNAAGRVADYQGASGSVVWESFTWNVLHDATSTGI